LKNIVSLPASNSRQLALDHRNGKLYWTDPVSDKIFRSNLDGTRLEEYVSQGLDDPYGIALDLRTPGDFDDDGDVDLNDFARFQNCFTGEGPRGMDAPCTFFDADPADGDVDAANFAVFAGALSGPQ